MAIDLSWYEAPPEEQFRFKDIGNIEDERRIIVNYSYPNNTDYEYSAHMERIDFDKEMELDLINGEGFIISNPKATIKKDIKDPDGIFSSRFGQKLGDANPYIDRYSCSCGNLKSRINNGIQCPICHTLCKFVDDDFKMFGWIKLIPEYPIIHPDIFKQLDSFFGKSKYDKKSHNRIKGSKLKNILEYDAYIDINGHEVEGSNAKPDEPYYGKGFLFFINNFDEIMKYYIDKYPKKREIYDDIMKDRDKVFIHAIPVFTSHLRPMDISAGTMYLEKCTAIYNMMVKLAHKVNKAKTKSDRITKVKCQELYNLQMKYMELYDEIIAILNGKRGQLRNLISGRYNFSARSVIRQDPSLRIDQIKLPYAELVITYKAQIENILHRMYNISFQEAYNKWYKSLSNVDPTIVHILELLIANGPKDEFGNSLGLPHIINRNPSINYGSILQVFCVGINYDYTMSTSLQILKPLAADYDGDVLNIMAIINDAFFQRAYQIFNPRNAMYINRNNGLSNSDIFPQRDTLINSNTLIGLAKRNYNQNTINRIKALQGVH